jgi:hypothetical protein
MKQASISGQEPKQSIAQYYVPTSYFDQATKIKIHRHLTDINDVISEDDIRNIDTSITLRQQKNLQNS